MHGQEPDVVVQSATRHDVALVAAILGEALCDDPVARWIDPNDRRRRHDSERYFLLVAKHLYLRHDGVYLTEGASGAAMWLPPGVSSDSLPLAAKALLLWRVFWAVGPSGLRRAMAMYHALRARHPREPHYYLHAVGVRPGHQGRGIGSALVRHMTERCDREGVLAYLENSNERNLPFYERQGFRVTGEWVTPGGGSTVWFMARPPRDRA